MLSFRMDQDVVNAVVRGMSLPYACEAMFGIGFVSFQDDVPVSIKVSPDPCSKTAISADVGLSYWNRRLLVFE